MFLRMAEVACCCSRAAAAAAAAAAAVGVLLLVVAEVQGLAVCLVGLERRLAAVQGSLAKHSGGAQVGKKLLHHISNMLCL
jgi:hypothetical protein